MSNVARVEFRASDESFRHWSPQSQNYASADILVQYLANGWTVESPAVVESHSATGARRSEVYHFHLIRNEQDIEMPVLANPVVSRLIEQYELTVLRVNNDRGETL